MAGERDGDAIDRDAILLRRTLFVTSAVAALGCSNGTPDDGAPHPTVEPTATATATSTVAVTPPKLTPWEELVREAPPLEVDPALPVEEKTQLVGAVDWAKRSYDALRDI